MNFIETEELVHRSVAGETSAFEELYKATSKRVYFVCLNFLRNDYDANDAVQDTYLTAFKNLSQLAEPGKFSAWIERIAVNRCKNILRQKNPTPIDDEVLKETLFAEDELSLPEKYITDSEKRKFLLNLLQTKLSPLQYQTVILYYFNNMSASEIGQILDCSEGAVYNRLSTARAKIKKAVDEYEQENNDKLFTFAGVPFLSKLFDEESKVLNPPKLNTAMLSQGKATKGISKDNGRKIIETMNKNKLRAPIIISAIVIVAVAGIFAIPHKNTKLQPQQAVESETVSSEEPEISSQEEEELKPDTSTAETDTEIDDPMKNMGNIVAEKADELMQALSDGDLETISTFMNSDFINNMKDSEEFGKILHAVYGDAVWNTDGITDSTVYDEYKTAKNLDRNWIDVHIDVGTKRYMYYQYYDLLRYSKGDHIPDGFEYKTEEEAWEAFEETLALMPRIYQRWTLRMGFPDEDGNFTLSLAGTDFQYFIDDSFTIEHAREDNLLIKLLAEICEDDVIISPENSVIKYNDEANGGECLRQEAVELLKKKDFEGARKLIFDKTGEEFSSIGEDYANLSDNQKKYVAEVLDNSTMYSIETAHSENGEKSVVLLLDCPVLEYNLSSTPENLMQWIDENELRDIDVLYATKEFSVGGFVDDVFGYYHDVIMQAKYNVEE